MARLSAAIMAHPKRELWVPALELELPGAQVVWDERNSRWDTGRRALLAHDPDATHHLVVQDDAVLCADFLTACQEMIEHSGDLPICLYMGVASLYYCRMARTARAHGTPWFTSEGPRWGPAIVVPTRHIHDIVAFGDRDEVDPAYDGKITRYYARHKITCLYTVPPLADHRGVEENPSLVAGRTADRHSYLYDGESPLGTDWSIPPNRKRSIQRVTFTDGRIKRIVARGGAQYKKLSDHKDWEVVR